MKTFVLTLAFVLAASASASAATTTLHTPHVTIVQSDAPVKRIDWEVVVPAPIGRVWDAFTTQAGMTSWLAPQARVQLEPGGEWRAAYPGHAEAGGNVVAFQPDTLLVLSAMAPEAFPSVRRDRTLAVFSFAPHGDGETTVHLAQTGWKTGDEWDKAYAYLTNGNAQLLESLYERFATGKGTVWTK